MKRPFKGIVASSLHCGLVLAALFSGMTTATTMQVDTSIDFDKDAFTNLSKVGTDGSNYQYMSLKKLGSGGEKVTYVQFSVGNEYSPGSDSKVELVLAARQVAGDTTIELRQASNTTWAENLVNDGSGVVTYDASVLKSFDVTTQAKVANSVQGSLYTLDISDLITAPGTYSFALTISANTNLVDFFTSNATFAGNQPKINITNFASKGFSVSPSYFLLNQTGNVSARKQTITITNEGTYDIKYQGQDSYSNVPSEQLHDQYNKSANSCTTSTVLSTGQSCSFDLTQQNSVTTKHDIYRIKYKYPDLDNTVRYFPIFIKDASTEPVAEQAKRRVPPLLKSFRLTNTGTDTKIVAMPIAGSDYDIKFTVDGYHENYRAVVALFDCADTSNENCASSFGSNIGWLEASADGTSTGSTSYDSYDSAATDFTGTITMPVYSNNLVARVYYRSDVDETINNSFISVIASGGQGLDLADGLGRKIIIDVE